MSIGRICAAIGAGIAWLGAMWAAPATAAPTGSVEIGEIGHLYVGGREVELRDQPQRPRLRAPGRPVEPIDLNGSFVVGATYVGFVKLAKPRHEYPIVLVPGGGLSGAVYETTPDGRAGWQWFFLKAGYSTYLVDLDQTGRSSFARYPEINPDEPSFRSQAFMWEVFRIGPPKSFASRIAYGGTQFPVPAFAAFAKQAQPRFRFSPETEARVYEALVHSVCPCILLTHSASGLGGMSAAARWPDLVKAVISVEPSDAPGDVPSTAAVPQLFVWGDYLDPAQTDPSWADEVGKSRAYRLALSSRGGVADWIDLPAQGVHGNSHMLMLDRNSDAVADLVERWLQRQGF